MAERTTEDGSHYFIDKDGLEFYNPPDCGYSNLTKEEICEMLNLFLVSCAMESCSRLNITATPGGETRELLRCINRS